MELTMQVEIKGITEVKNLLELLHTKFDELPAEIKDSIMQIEEFGISDFDAESAHSTYGYFKVYENSLSNDYKIIKINKVLKKVVYLYDHKEIIEYPEHFWHSFDGKKVVEW